jgi:hypothetical protein
MGRAACIVAILVLAFAGAARASKEIHYDYAGVWVPTAPPPAGQVPVVDFDVRYAPDIPAGPEPRYELRLRYRCNTGICTLGPLASGVANESNLAFYSPRPVVGSPWPIGQCQIMILLVPRSFAAPQQLRSVRYMIYPRARSLLQCRAPTYPFFRERTDGEALRELARRLPDSVVPPRF